MVLFQVVIVCYRTVSGWYRVSWGCFTSLLYVIELFQVGIACHEAVSCCCMLWELFQVGIVCHGDVSQCYHVPRVKHIEKKDSCLQNKPHLWLFT